MDTYDKFNLKKVINASGKMTILGVSKVNDESIDAQKFGDKNFFVIKDLVNQTGKYIAKKLGCENALIVNSASAGIAQAVCSVIGKGSDYQVFHPYDAKYTNREIILPKGQNVDYGTPEEVMIEVGGGKVVEAGYANMCNSKHIEMMINDKTAAIFYVKSHHAVQKSMLGISDALTVAHEHKLPLILDAAAEEDLQKYVDLGVDIIIFSGAKSIEGPASGLVFGKNPYIDWIKKQSLGIGRSMKIGKENILGFVSAFEKYINNGPENGNHMRERLQPFVKKLNTISFIEAEEVQDSAGRQIYRASVKIAKEAPIKASQLVDKLKLGNPAIYTREYRSNEGIIEFDIRAVESDEMNEIIHRLKEILGD